MNPKTNVVVTSYSRTDCRMRAVRCRHQHRTLLSRPVTYAPFGPSAARMTSSAVASSITMASKRSIKSLPERAQRTLMPRWLFIQDTWGVEYASYWKIQVSPKLQTRYHTVLSSAFPYSRHAKIPPRGKSIMSRRFCSRRFNPPWRYYKPRAIWKMFRISYNEKPYHFSNSPINYYTHSESLVSY